MTLASTNAATIISRSRLICSLPASLQAAHERWYVQTWLLLGQQGFRGVTAAQGAQTTLPILSCVLNQRACTACAQSPPREVDTRAVLRNRRDQLLDTSRRR